ncbi:MAG: hypothetical protein ACE5HQ_05130 [Gemmatimonadota bacterium]
MLGATVPSPVAAQYRLVAPAGRELIIPQDSALRMLETSRALAHELDTDPRVLYFTGVGDAVTEDAPEQALPWNAVSVVTDSTAAIQTPGNLREGARAYSNYAVMRMGFVRGDPDVSCDSLMAEEVAAVEAFADGWVVSRTLFGGLEYGPLDEIAFARADHQLPGLIADRDDRQLGGCLAVWRRKNQVAVEAYRAWRRDRFLGGSSGGGVSSPGR